MARERHQIHDLFIWLVVVACISGLINFCNIVGANAEHWSDADSPLKFASDLILTLDDLPSNGEAENIPWSGNYWPTYKDSINQPWAGPGTTPPSQKYAVAFGRNADRVMDQVSLHHGIDSQSHRTSCTNNSDCSSILGLCSKRSGHNTGYCIPTWFGIDHAWVSASLLLNEPRHEVEHNGINFKVNDIKALITLLHNRVDSSFVSLRCNTDASAVHLDNYGRPTGVDSECRDTNPGTLHVLLANYLGIRGASFIEDRTWDDEVWNQPIRGYRVTRQEEITASEANRLIGVTSTGGVTKTASGDVAKDQWYHMDPIAVGSGQNIKVAMTGTNDADLYVRSGAVPTQSAYDCRPYKTGSNEECHIVSTGAPIHVAVMGYAALSDFTLHIEYPEGKSGLVPINPPVEVNHLNVRDSVALGGSKHYTINLPAGYATRIQTFSSGNVDLYIQANRHPTPTEYLMRGYTSTGNEIINYRPQSNITLHIMVHGYQAASFTLRTAPQ